MTLLLLRALGVVAALAPIGPGQSLVPLTPGMVVDRSVTPIKTITTNRFDHISGRTIEDGVARDRFAPVVEGAGKLPAGNNMLRVISDDGVRAWVDGAMILDEWTAHESKVSRVPVVGRERHFKVEYYDVTGFAELRFEIQRK